MMFSRFVRHGSTFRATAPNFRKLSMAPPEDRPIVGGIARLTLYTPFQKAFSDRLVLKHFLSSFLNTSDPIKSITDVQPGDSRIKNVILDVHCVLESGSKIIFKLQKATSIPSHAHMVDIAVGDVTKDYYSQLKINSLTKLDPLTPVVAVVILDWSFISSPFGSFVQQYQSKIVRGSPSPILESRLNELFDFTYVELNLAPKCLTPTSTDAEKWSILLRDSNTYSIDTLPVEFKSDPYARAVSNAIYENMTELELAHVYKEEGDERELACRLIATKKLNF